MADTNVRVGEDDVLRFLHLCLEFIEKNFNADSPEVILAKRLQKELGPGNRECYHTVPREFADDVRKMLVQSDISFTFTPTPGIDGKPGEILFLVGEKNEDDLYDILSTVMSRSTAFARQNTAERLVNNAIRSNEEKVVSLTFEDRGMAYIAQQELYDNRIVCALSDLPDGRVEILIDNNALTRSSGKDLVGMELRQAMYQSSGDFNRGALDLKKAQAIYDHDTVLEFAKAIKEGKSCVLGNAEKLSDAPYLTCKNGEVQYHANALVKEKDGKERMQYTEFNIKIEENASVGDIMATISKNALEIRDKVIYDNIHEWRNGSKDVVADKIAMIAKNGKELRPTDASFNKKSIEKTKNKVMSKFVNSVRKGEECVIGSPRFTKNGNYLSTKNGEVFFHKKGTEPVKVMLTGTEDNARIFDAIKAATGGQIDAFAICRSIAAWETKEPVEIRSELEDHSKETVTLVDIPKAVENQMLSAIAAISHAASADAIAISNGRGQKKADVYENKREIVYRIMSDQNELSRVLQDAGVDMKFLNEPVGQSGITAMEWLTKKTLKSFEATDEPSKEECIVKIEKLTQKKVEELRNRGKEDTKDASIDKGSEKITEKEDISEKTL